MKTFHFLGIIIMLLLGALTVFCEIQTRAAEQERLSKWQAKVGCLANESRKVPDCAAKLKLRPDDFDFCAKAVTACKIDGSYAAAAAADDAYGTWRDRGRTARIWLAAFAFIVVASITLFKAAAWFVHGRTPR